MLRKRPSHLVALTLGALARVHVDALIHEQVAFDSADVCWWSLTPPDPVCPVLRQQNITQLLEHLNVANQWQGGTECEGAYCLYANRGFAAGRGIAVITDPANLAKVKQVGNVLQEYEVSFDDDAENVPFRISDVEEDRDGAVVVASKSLTRGDPIMAHTPVLLVHPRFRADAAPDRQQRLLQRALDALPAKTARKLKDRLDNAHASAAAPDLVALLAAEAFPVPLETMPHDGLFPEAANIAHDCRPSTVAYVDPVSLMLITTATSPIHPGHELTLSRLDPFATYEDRQAQAHAKWGHPCTCSQCRLDGSEAADSATRLHEIKWIEGKLRDPASAEISTGIIAYYLGLHENERLQCCLSAAYQLAAENFNMLGHESHALKYADLAIESFKMEKGDGVAQVREMQKLKKNPKGHATWKQRVGADKASAQDPRLTQPVAAANPASTTKPTNTP